MTTNDTGTHLPSYGGEAVDVPVVCGRPLAVGVQVVDVDNDECASGLHVVVAILHLWTKVEVVIIIFASLKPVSGGREEEDIMPISKCWGNHRYYNTRFPYASLCR